MDDDDGSDVDYSNIEESMKKTSLQSYEECKKCEIITRNTDELPFPETRYLVTHMEASILHPRHKRLQEKLREAMLWCYWRMRSLVSAVKNSGGGAVLVHICGMEQSDSSLDIFHEVVKNSLETMLENGSLCFNTFRVKWMMCMFKEIGQTQNDLFSNVVFVGAKPSPSVSTVNFNTTVANDFELLNPTYEQQRRYLKIREIFKSTKPHIRGLLNLQERGNVMDEYTSKDPCRLAKNIWNSLRLNHCLSAFSKVEGGGSFYLGVSKKQKFYSSYCTTQVDIKGFQYGPQQRDELKAALSRQIENETLVLFFDSEAPPAPLPPEYVDIVFHKVYAGRVVLEVAIAVVNGIVFHSKEGPEAYELDKDGKLQRLDVHEWKSRLLKE